MVVVTRLKENMNLVSPFETPEQAACPQGQTLQWLVYDAGGLAKCLLGENPLVIVLPNIENATSGDLL